VQLITGREDKVENLGTYVTMIDYQQNFNATGDHTVDTLPRDLNQSYLMVMCDDGASGAISHGECRINNLTIRERLPISVNAMAVDMTGLQQPSGYYVYNFTDGGLKSRLPMNGVKDLRFLNTFTTAAGAGGYVMTAVSAVNFPNLDVNNK
jgi:hypothetical protein